MREVKKVICELCGQEISASNLSKHIRRHQNHPETFLKKEIYHTDHDDLFCKFCGKECKNKNSLVQHELRCKENPNKIDTSKSFNNRNKPAWNKGLTKETDERVAKYAISHHNNHVLGLHKDTSGNNNPSSRIEIRQKISKTCLDKSKNGEWHKSLAKDLHYKYNGVDLDGKWELYYAMYLDEQGISWQRCVDKFLYEFEGKNHYYTPDFYLNDFKTFIEIKGYETEKDRAKWEQFPADKTLVVLKEKELKALGIL